MKADIFGSSFKSRTSQNSVKKETKPDKIKVNVSN
jgi:hypothetical protein